MRVGFIKKIIPWMLFFVAFVIVLFGKNYYANAAELRVKANYDDSTVTNALEIVLDIESSSKLTMVKYKYARIAKTTHFTKYESNGIPITQNEDGNYSFFATQNGYVTIVVINEAGEEALLTYKLKNIDTTPPELKLLQEKSAELYHITPKASDDYSDNISIKYVEGSYASPTHRIWESAKSAKNNEILYLEEGKYTFLATDEAGNTTVEIKRFEDTNDSEKEFRAVWISYLDFKTTGYTEKEFRAHIEKMFDDAAAMNMNAVVVHVRPFGDAMYKSRYYPWSKYVSGEQGKNPGFDPLTIMVEEAHARDLEFHAWLNPYRITSSSTDVMDLSEDNPARIYRTDSNKTNDRYVLTYSGKLYYNPSVSQVQTLIVNGIKEIVRNYDVDGIHFDDYFYPSLGKNFTKNFDAPEYEKYKEKQMKKNQEYLSISDWRRDNVNTLVKKVYSAVKKIDPTVVFGISPGGFIDSLKANDKYYVDFETWLGYDGYIDYLCPQLYWSNEHSVYPFNEILDRFLDVERNPDVKFYVGVAAHKAGITSEESAWYKDVNVLRNMIRQIRSKDNVDGFIIYSYRAINAKPNNKAIKNMLTEINKLKQ